MAILKGIFRKQTGSIGDMTLRVVNGQTVTSEKVTRNTSKTFAQMVRRVQWANMVNLYRAFEGTLHPSFESRPRSWSDFNAFMSANIGQFGVYLTASEASQGGCLVAPYQITRGSLPSVGMGTTEAGVITSDIKVGALDITDETTLAAFSAAVRANNSGWEYGDQLSAYVALQKVNTITQVPYVEVHAYEITLAEDDETLVLDLIDNDPTCFAVVDQKLCLNAPINGGACYVHSRKDGQKTRVSTQRFTATNDLLDAYTTEAKRTEAIISYGGKTSGEFLTPNLGN
jgi:hypothetical protein